MDAGEIAILRRCGCRYREQIIEFTQTAAEGRILDPSGCQRRKDDFVRGGKRHRAQSCSVHRADRIPLTRRIDATGTAGMQQRVRENNAELRISKRHSKGRHPVARSKDRRIEELPAAVSVVPSRIHEKCQDFLRGPCGDLERKAQLCRIHRAEAHERSIEGIEGNERSRNRTEQHCRRRELTVRGKLPNPGRRRVREMRKRLSHQTDRTFIANRSPQHRSVAHARRR